MRKGEQEYKFHNQVGGLLEVKAIRELQFFLTLYFNMYTISVSSKLYFCKKLEMLLRSPELKGMLM